MDCNIQIAWFDFSECLTGADNGFPYGPVGYVFVPPEQAVSWFVAAYPQHEPCRSRLVERLAGTGHHVESRGLVRIHQGSLLADAMQP